MKSLALPFCIAITFLFSLPSVGQQAPSKWLPTVYSSHDKLRQGTKMRVAIHFTGLTPSSANQPFPLRQPLNFELNRLPGFNLSDIEYQKNKDVFRFSVSAAPGTPPGQYTFSGRLVDYSDFAVKAFPASFVVEVVPRDAKVRKTNNPYVSPAIPAGEILLMPLRILEGIFEVLIACPLSGQCSS